MSNVFEIGDKKSPHDQIIQKLNEKIPEAVISERDAGNGRKLDYLEGWYVIDRLNKVFGQGNWAYDTADMREVFRGEVNGKFVTSYVAKITLYVNIDGVTTSFTDYGYGDGQDPRNPGKAHELAVKEAVTDGIKRCAKNLGPSMGLALYDKSRENVETTEGTESKPKSRIGYSTGAKAKQPGSVSDTHGVPNTPQPSIPERTVPATQAQPRDEVNALISSTANVLNAKGIMSFEQIRTAMVQKYGTAQKGTLTDAQAKEFLDYLGTLNA